MFEVSLIDGPLPVVVWVLGVAAAGYLAWLPNRRWWTTILPLLIAASALLTVGLKLFLERVWPPFPEPLELTVVLWLGVCVAAVVVGIARLWFGRWWQRVTAVVATLLLVALGALQINRDFQYDLTVGDLLGVASADEIDTLPSDGAGGPPVTGPLATNWQPTGANIPAAGKTVQIDLPGTASGFDARQAWVYLPPAYFADNAVPLPVIVLMAGQPGDPQDWLTGNRVPDVLDPFAAAHRGIAPVVVIPDVLGSTLGNPMCVDSSIAKVDTYLSKDVPAGIKQQLRVESDPKSWAVAGFSYGGTCSILMTTNHPDIYPTFVDISGELEPTLGSRDQTVQQAFGGNAAAFTAINPLDLMKSKQYPGVAGWFTVGQDDAQFEPGQQTLFNAAKAAGMDVQFYEVPGAGHDWTAAQGGLQHTIDWLGTRLGITPSS